ncbi:unnamed protein product [Durusdinium trenchii]|uniref:Uncharacterized protein n=1 Tax=Durusdinium trenchii TaxID=1381693 RepID=A0ABP0HRF2_9DINO
MELARLRTALGEGQGQHVDLEIDKLRALLGVVEADVRLLRQVKDEEGGLQECTDGEFILRSPQQRKKLLSQAVQTAASLQVLRTVRPSAASPPVGQPPEAVPQGLLRAVKSALELRKSPVLRPIPRGGSASSPQLPGLPMADPSASGVGGAQRAVAIMPLQGATKLRTSSSTPKLQGIGEPEAWSGGRPKTSGVLGFANPAASSTSTSPANSQGATATGEARSRPPTSGLLAPVTRALSTPSTSSTRSQGMPCLPASGMLGANQADSSPSTSPAQSQGRRSRPPRPSTDSVPCAHGEHAERHCERCRQPLPSVAPEASELLVRLEAAGIGPWQIAELKASEARLAELGAGRRAPRLSAAPRWSDGG